MFFHSIFWNFFHQETINNVRQCLFWMRGNITLSSWSKNGSHLEMQKQVTVMRNKQLGGNPQLRRGSILKIEMIPAPKKNTHFMRPQKPHKKMDSNQNSWQNIQVIMCSEIFFKIESPTERGIHGIWGLAQGVDIPHFEWLIIPHSVQMWGEMRILETPMFFTAKFFSSTCKPRRCFFARISKHNFLPRKQIPSDKRVFLAHWLVKSSVWDHFLSATKNLPVNGFTQFAPTGGFITAVCWHKLHTRLGRSMLAPS